MRNILFAIVVLLLCTSCASLGGASASTSGNNVASTSSSNSQSLLGSLLSGLVGSAVPLSEKTLIGTWHYSSPECRFESESALAQAGGAVAANTVEEKLASAYAQLGLNNCSYTFNEDKTCSITLNGRTINGSYTLNTETRTLNITSNTGLIKLNATVYYSLSELTLLFDTQKLLTLAQMVSAFTGKGSGTLATLSSMLSQYDGMKIGMNLKK